jgi:predicted ArsR family transcriptional regulator
MIDPQELEEALDNVENMPKGRYADILIAAARAHLATLPKWKDVEVTAWAIVSAHGRVEALFNATERGAATTHVDRFPGTSLVRLTGTAKVRV